MCASNESNDHDIIKHALLIQKRSRAVAGAIIRLSNGKYCFANVTLVQSTVINHCSLISEHDFSEADLARVRLMTSQLCHDTL